MKKITVIFSLITAVAGFAFAQQAEIITLSGGNCEIMEFRDRNLTETVDTVTWETGTAGTMKVVINFSDGSESMVFTFSRQQKQLDDTYVYSDVKQMEPETGKEKYRGFSGTFKQTAGSLDFIVLAKNSTQWMRLLIKTEK